VQPVYAKKAVTLDFFYSGSCGSCREKFPIIQELEHNATYNTTVQFYWKDTSYDEAAREEYETVYDPMFRANHSFPLTFVVIKNDTARTIITGISVLNISVVLDDYLAGTPHTEPDETPGFALILLLMSIPFVLFMKRRRKS